MTDPPAPQATPATAIIPEPGIWIIDPVHSFVSFRVWHQAVSYARGMAAGPTGVITIEADLLDSGVVATIDATTITTLHPVRDAKVRGIEVLDVERFPRIEFTSTGLSLSEQNRYAMGGRLNMHGITKQVSLDLAFNGVVEDNWGKPRLGVTANADLVRNDFGIGSWGNVALKAGGFMVPGRVEVTLDIEATRDDGADQ